MDDHAHLRLAANAGLCPEPLDFHPGDPGARKLLFNVGPDGQILLDEGGHVLRVPPRLPIADDPDPQPYRMDLLPHAVTSTNLPSLPGLPSLPSLHSLPSLPAWSLDCGDWKTGETVETQRYPPLSATTTVTWLLRLVMMSARPRARGCTRFVDGPSSAYARETFSVSRSSSRLFSALATADFKTFSTARAARDDVNRSIASASFTGRPRIIRTTSWTFFGESLRYFASALASIPASRYDPACGAGGGVAGVGAAAGVTPVVRSAAAAAAAVAPAAPCPLKIRVGENSPSLWPTICSAT